MRRLKPERRAGLGDACLAIALATGLVVLSWVLRDEEVVGSVRIVDGDTLAIEGRRIRIKGIDAPELAQTCERDGTTYQCGEIAREGVRALVAGRPVSCRVAGRDRYGRDVAWCRSGDEDIGGALVRRGLAVASGSYLPEEREAKARGLGLWAGRFETPSEWRRRHGPGSTD